jgi:hypothetical protein
MRECGTDRGWRLRFGGVLKYFLGGGKNVFVHTKGTRNAVSTSPKKGFTRAKVSNIGRIDPNQLVREILPSSATSRHRRGHVNR